MTHYATFPIPTNMYVLYATEMSQIKEELLFNQCNSITVNCFGIQL